MRRSVLSHPLAIIACCCAAQAAIMAPTTAVLSSCTPQEAKTARDATLSVVNLACIFNSVAVNEAAVAKACDVKDNLLPEIRNLIAIREAARRSGVSWTPTSSDAGRPDGDAP